MRPPASAPLPLAGRRVLLTRRWPALAARLGALGASVMEVPTITILPADDPAPLDRALGGLAGYQWLVFTSANAVEAVARRLETLGLALPAPLRLASVGPATTLAIAAAWPAARVEVQPDAEFRAAELVAAFAGVDLEGCRVLLPVSDRAGDGVPRGLAARGAVVDRVVGYRTRAASTDGLADAIRAGIDAVVFASPSAVEGYLGASGDRGSSVPTVVMGPTTADAVRVAGLSVLAQAQPSTLEGLVAALLRALGPPEASAPPPAGLTPRA